MPELPLTEERFAAGLDHANSDAFLDYLFGEGREGKELALMIGGTFLQAFREAAHECPARPSHHTLMEVFMSAFTAGFACGENSAGAGG